MVVNSPNKPTSLFCPSVPLLREVISYMVQLLILETCSLIHQQVQQAKKQQNVGYKDTQIYTLGMPSKCQDRI